MKAGNLFHSKVNKIQLLILQINVCWGTSLYRILNSEYRIQNLDHQILRLFTNPHQFAF